MRDLVVGFAMCGSYCTFSRVLPVAEKLAEKYTILPIMSENVYATDNRFGKAEDFRRRLEQCCGRPVIHSVRESEPIGPKGLLDALVIAPCTGNTIGKMAAGITDTAVTMAAKAHLRNGRPVIIAVSSNDALGAGAEALGKLFARKNLYFVPFCQDEPLKKPTSLVAEFELIDETLQAALSGWQLQPLLRIKKLPAENQQATK